MGVGGTCEERRLRGTVFGWKWCCCRRRRSPNPGCSELALLSALLGGGGHAGRVAGPSGPLCWLLLPGAWTEMSIKLSK